MDMTRQRLPILFWVLTFQIGLTLIGLLCAQIFLGSLGSLKINLDDLHVSLTASIPVVLFAILATSRWGIQLPGLKGVYQSLKASGVRSLIVDSHWVNLLLISVLAGISEEILFRGIIQVKLGIIVASIIFGALHSLTATYFVIATLMGFYLGYVFERTEHNLAIPMIVHALYDFVAFLLYKRRMTR